MDPLSPAHKKLGKLSKKTPLKRAVDILYPRTADVTRGESHVLSELAKSTHTITPADLENTAASGTGASREDIIARLLQKTLESVSRPISLGVELQ